MASSGLSATSAVSSSSTSGGSACSSSAPVAISAVPSSGRRASESSGELGRTLYLGERERGARPGRSGRKAAQRWDVGLPNTLEELLSEGMQVDADAPANDDERVFEQQGRPEQ